MVGEDPGAPAPHGAGEPGQLVDVDLDGPLEELVEPDAGLGEVLGGVDAAEQLAGDPGALDLEPRVAGVEGFADVAVGAVVESLDPDEQQPADAIQRVTLVATMTQGLLLVRRRTSSTTWLPRRIA